MDLTITNSDTVPSNYQVYVPSWGADGHRVSLTNATYDRLAPGESVPV